MIQRREFIPLLASAAAWPLAAWAQQRTAMPVIGYLGQGAPATATSALETAFRNGLSEMGFVEGRNVRIEYRWSEGHYDRLPDLAADLVRLRVNVIAAMGGAVAGLAAKRATTTIPIVFRTGFDPVQSGLVASLNRPGGNATGFSSMDLSTKRLGLLRDLLPKATRFAILVDPNAPSAEIAASAVEVAAAGITQQIDVLRASTNREITRAFDMLVQTRVDAVLVGANNLFGNRRVQLVTLAAHHRIPAIYFGREFVEIGGLMSYGSSLLDEFRQAGIYAGRILKGDKPADLPVIRPTRFDLVINLQTAAILGLEIPPSLFAIATEVIE
jgi:putative ABC transport system substrate-binding protein